MHNQKSFCIQKLTSYVIVAVNIDITQPWLHFQSEILVSIYNCQICPIFSLYWRLQKIILNSYFTKFTYRFCERCIEKKTDDDTNRHHRQRCRDSD